MRLYYEEDSGLSDEEQKRKGSKKSPKAHTKTNTSRQETLFVEIQKQFFSAFQDKSNIFAADVAFYIHGKKNKKTNRNEKHR